VSSEGERRGADGAAPSRGYGTRFIGGTTSVSSGASDVAPTERRPPGVMGRDFWRDDLRVVRGQVTRRRRSGALQGRWDAIFWRDDLRVVRGREMWRRRSGALQLPIQYMEFALVGPIAGLLDEACTDGVFQRVLPLCTVAFLFPQLRVPVVRLPNGRVVGIWPMA
jgi:hypothetical protein